VRRAEGEALPLLKDVEERCCRCKSLKMLLVIIFLSTRIQGKRPEHPSCLSFVSVNIVGANKVGDSSFVFGAENSGLGMSLGEREPVFATLLDPPLMPVRELSTGNSRISRYFCDRTTRQFWSREVVHDVINLPVGVNMA
jgi:hypothetical protein